MSPERISIETGIDAASLASELTMMELDGLILRTAGGITLAP
jgi:hypothetical protein